MVERLVRRIRDGQPREAAELEGLQRRSSLAWEEYRADLEAHPEAIEVAMPVLEAGHVRVAEGADGPLGFSVLLPGADGTGELDGLFVDPTWFRRGVGRALIADAVARARDRGWRRIEVTANPRAIEFYVKQGFIDDGIVHTRFGPGLRMHLDLPSRTVPGGVSPPADD